MNNDTNLHEYIPASDSDNYVGSGVNTHRHEGNWPDCNLEVWGLRNELRTAGNAMQLLSDKFGVELKSSEQDVSSLMLLKKQAV